MSFQDTEFRPISADRIQVDRPIVASDLADISQNINYLYKIATDRNLPGSTSTFSGHDHREHGGAQIPLYLLYEVGTPSVPALNAYDEYLPLTRALSSAGSDYLYTPQYPFPVVDGSQPNNLWRFWVGNNVAALFDGCRHLTLEDSGNTGRYFIKHVEYDESREATLVKLFSPLSQTPVSGAAVHPYQQIGSTTFTLYLPEWANRVHLLFPAACTLSTSTGDGEQYHELGENPDFEWMLRLCLSHNGVAGDCLKVYPKKDLIPRWRYLSYDCKTLAKNTDHDFKIEIQENTTFFTVYQPVFDRSDACLWFKGFQHEPRPHIYALLTP